MILKKASIHCVLFLFLLSAGCHFAYAQSSVLQSGSWYKVGVKTRGVYKISFDQFKSMGFDSNADPRKIRIYGNKGGMLPQALAEWRADDLTENAIHVEGESDGVFNSGDYILFYGEGADGVSFDVNSETFKYEHNLYSDYNYYFITVSTDNGKRIGSSENINGVHPVIRSYDDFVYHEIDEYNELKSGREWFGERFDLTTQYVFNLNLTDVVADKSIKLVSDVMAQAFAGSSFTIAVNGVDVGTQTVSPIPNTQYGTKGRHQRDTLVFNTTATSNLELKYQYNKASSGKSVGFLDFFLFQVTRKLVLSNNQTIFSSINSLDQVVSSFEIGNVTTDSRVWDVTDPYEIQEQKFTTVSDKLIFSTATEVLKTFVVFNSNLSAPEFVGKVENQNLHGLGVVNFLIVAHPDFYAEAERLATHRQQYSGYNTVVVTPQQIYNEFSSGRQDVAAIRDFIKYLFENNSTALKAVLMFGRGSYDYKDRVSNNTNFVPVYESRNSLAPLETYSSDDYFGFLEMHEGNWGESPAQNHTMDVGVGRLPVKSMEEARILVDKIIAYDKGNGEPGHWQKSIVFVADDGSISDGFTSIHQSQANSLAEDIDASYPEFNQRKVFMGAYEKTVRPGGESIPEVNERIVQEFNQALVINYTGHGSERIWADERVFTENEINALENARFPFLVTATCEFGRNDDPAQISSAEKSILHAAGGAIGLVTTARPVYSFSNFELNQAFYEAFFQREDNKPIWLGEIFRRTKNNSTSGVGNRNFSLLADPAMTLKIPTNKVAVTSFQTITGSLTLKALSTVVLKGEIRDDTDQLQTNFNGYSEITLFDKRMDYVTVGKNNPPYAFSQWSNVLFRGKASVNDGKFEITFTLPKNIAYQPAEGKLSLLAVDTSTYADASGSYNGFDIGGTESNPVVDNQSPEMKLYMNDTTFRDGGTVRSSSTLLVRLKDENGINISSYGIGNVIMATLDDDAAIYSLNDFYQADLDDATRGWIHYPITNLEPGRHTLTVKVWDLHNNLIQEKISFYVTEGEALIIESLAGYPNPFLNETAIVFTHNRAGDDLEGELIVYKSTGEQLEAHEFSIPNSPYRVNLSDIVGLLGAEKKLSAGIYLVRVTVRSLSNGTINERVTKLIAVH